MSSTAIATHITLKATITFLKMFRRSYLLVHSSCSDIMPRPSSHSYSANVSGPKRTPFQRKQTSVIRNAIKVCISPSVQGLKEITLHQARITQWAQNPLCMAFLCLLFPGCPLPLSLSFLPSLRSPGSLPLSTFTFTPSHTFSHCV